MLQGSSSLTAKRLYEEAFSMKFNWQNILPLDVDKYHELIWKETNALVDLQMGAALPFAASCLGPTTKGLFLICVTPLNLFWIIVGASGTGKSQSQQHFISDLLEYILKNKKVDMKDFEIFPIYHMQVRIS